MPLRLSIINDRLDEYIAASGDKPDVAFTKLVHAIIRDCDYDDLQPEDVVDGVVVWGRTKRSD